MRLVDALVVATTLCGQGGALSAKDIVSVRYSAFEYETNVPITRESVRKCVEVFPKLSHGSLAELAGILSARYPKTEFRDGRVRLRVEAKNGGELFVNKEREL